MVQASFGHLDGEVAANWQAAQNDDAGRVMRQSFEVKCQQTARPDHRPSFAREASIRIVFSTYR